MSVEFNEPGITPSRSGGTTGPRGIIGLVVRMGAARSEADAHKILWLVAVAAIAATIFIVWNHSRPIELPPPETFEGMP